MSKRNGLYLFWIRPIPWDYFANDCMKAFIFFACLFKYPDHYFFQISSSIVFALWAQQQGDGVSKGHDFRAVILVKLPASHDSDMQSLTRYNHCLVCVQPKSYFESQINAACGMGSPHFSAQTVSFFGNDHALSFYELWFDYWLKFQHLLTVALVHWMALSIGVSIR